MSLTYKVETTESSLNFTTDSGDNYSAYFLEYHLPDSEGNDHTVYNFGFFRNNSFDTELFSKKHDPKIKETLIGLVIDFFEKRGHSAILYFCFGDDGYARHRNIVFHRWCNDLPPSIEKYNADIKYNNNEIKSSLLILKDNPLKDLITKAYEKNLREIAALNEK